VTIDAGPRPIDTGLPSLDAFFSAAAEYARGRLSAEAFADKLGPSKSGLKRLALYPHLVKGDNRFSLNSMFQAAQKAVDRYKLGVWDRWLDEYQEKHATHDWRVRFLGEDFFQFVKDKRAADPHIPAYIEELCDLAWTRSAAMATPQPAADDEVMDKTVFVRHYTHNVTAFYIAVIDEIDTGLPEPKPTLTIIYQSRHTMRPRFFHPNIPALLALARRTKTAPELLAQFTQVTDEMIAAGEASLVEHGVLPARA
jgi:hypothetical protein